MANEVQDVRDTPQDTDPETTGAPALGHGTGGPEVGAADSEHLLAIYLGDHRGGAAGGVELARRVREENRGTDFEPHLAALQAEFMDERDALEDIATRLGVAPARVKTALGVLSVKLGALKPSGRLRRYSPLSRVLELEALMMGVQAKRHLWDALRFTSGAAAIDSGMLDRLAERAEAQLDTLHRLHREAAPLAFGAPEEALSGTT